MCVLDSFFCKQKTAYEMRISDWSADVCSSDLRSAQPSTRTFFPYNAAAAGIESRHITNTTGCEVTIAFYADTAAKERSAIALGTKLRRPHGLTGSSVESLHAGFCVDHINTSAAHDWRRRKPRRVAAAVYIG